MSTEPTNAAQGKGQNIKEYANALDNNSGSHNEGSQQQPPSEKKSPRIFVLSYDGCLTGSSELRALNLYKVSKEAYIAKQNKELNNLQAYSRDYDYNGLKKKEPFFDCYAAGLACYSDRKNFRYFPLEYTEEMYDESNENTHNKGVNSKLKTNIVGDGFTHDGLFGEDMYQKAQHVFLLSPFAEITVEKVKDLIEKMEKAIDTEKKDLVFHIQGESANTYANGCPVVEKTQKLSGMSAPGSIFKEAFNLYSGGIQAQKFRDLIKVNNNATAYSVQIINDDNIEGETVGKRERKMKELHDAFNGFGFSDHEKKYGIVDNKDTYFKAEKSNDETHQNLSEALMKSLPTEHQNITEDIISLVKNEYTAKAERYWNLNVPFIAQDAIDKDNPASLMFLGKHSTGQKDLALIGHRIYTSDSLGFGDLRGNFTLDFNPKMKHPTITGKEDAKWPRDKEEKPQTYGEDNKEATEKYYAAMKQKFIENFLHDMNYNILEHTGKISEFIADTSEIKSESGRAPFNERMMYMPGCRVVGESLQKTNSKLHTYPYLGIVAELQFLKPDERKKDWNPKHHALILRMKNTLKQQTTATGGSNKRKTRKAKKQAKGKLAKLSKTMKKLAKRRSLKLKKNGMRKTKSKSKTKSKK